MKSAEFFCLYSKNFRFQELREQRDLRQIDIAALLDVSPRHYQQIEYGKIDIPTSKLMLLANYFDVSIDYLVGRSDDPRRL